MLLSRVIRSRSPEATRSLAGRLARALLPRTLHGAVVVALQGELGAGKTVFVQGFLRGLGVRRSIQSPTFVLMREYFLPRRVLKAKHADLYRLRGIQDARALGLGPALRSKHSIVLVEWAGKARVLFPKNTLWVTLKRGHMTTERVVILHNLPRGVSRHI